VAAVALSLAMAGCKGTTPATEGEPAKPQAERPDFVEIALGRAEAATVDRIKAGHYLDALTGLHRLGESQRAAEIIARMQARRDTGEPLVSALPAAAQRRFQAIALEVALTVEDVGEVAQLLPGLTPVDPREKRDATRFEARVFAHEGRHADAARTLMPLSERASGDPVEMSEITASIWRHLSALPVVELARHADAPGITPAARAWWRLARDFNTALTGSLQRRLWQRWRARHPEHAAARFPPPELARIATDPVEVALFVPLGGDLAGAGEAIRDGFVAAYLHAASAGQNVRIYDTATLSVAVAYEQALRQGAQVIVGPLQKAAVAALARLRPEVPVVALNHLDRGDTESIVQLSLAVEDEAAAISSALIAGDVQRVVLFDSPSRWAARARTRFELDLGGMEIVGFGTFHDAEEVTAIVGDALHISESHARAQAIERHLGTSFEFTPRRRDDIDAVVAFVDAAELKTLKPALDFHFARDLPVFAPSPAIDVTDLERIEGVHVCVIPWRLQRGGFSAAVQEAFPASRGSYAGLFALGVDGFRLANQLPRLTARRTAISASTGILTLGEDGRIRRQLAWATVRDGKLVPVSSAPAGLANLARSGPSGRTPSTDVAAAGG